MANDNDSVDSNGNSTDLKPRRSSRAKGKPIQPLEDTDDNIVVHNNVVYKVGDFVYYLDKKQDIYRIGLIEEFKHQKRDKLVNKRPEISVKQFYRLDEIPSSVLSNHGEYDTHVMPPNFPEWLRQREIFISDNALSTSCSSLRSLCTVRHFPDLNHAMALFSTAQSSAQVTNSSPRIDHHTLINGKDNGCIPIPKQRDDNTFFYVYSYNARGRKLIATYLEIRVGPAYQAELPQLRSVDDQSTDPRFDPGAWEQLVWTPNQIPEAVFAAYNMATISMACFSGFGGGVDDSASLENGRKIASHMLTFQRALDCLHKSQYSMEKALEIFAENSLPETNKMPFLWTDEEHLQFDECVKIHGKNFLRIMQDKRNKKGRLVGDYVTFYYYWKKNRPKNKKYTTKKCLRSRPSNNALSELADPPDGPEVGSEKSVGLCAVDSHKTTGSEHPQSPSESPGECCTNCRASLPKEEDSGQDSDKAGLSDRIKQLCSMCQHYLRRYGYQRPLDIVNKQKTSDDGDFEDGVNGFDEEEDEEEEDDEEDEVFQPPDAGEDSAVGKAPGPAQDLKNTTLAINKYDFDEEDENVEAVSSLLKKSHAKFSHLGRSTITAQDPTKGQNSTPVRVPSSVPSLIATGKWVGPTTKTPARSSEPLPRPHKRTSDVRKSSSHASKKRKMDLGPDSARNDLSHSQIHDSLRSTVSLPAKSTGAGLGTIPGVRDTNSRSSSSSSSSTSSSNASNDSSLSSDEGDTPSTNQRLSDSYKSILARPEVDKDLVDLLSHQHQHQQPSSDHSYNQMITSVPNIPGVCAVTNVGEPMPLQTQNLSTDLSGSVPSSAPELQITVAEPLYKQLSIRNPGALATTSVTSTSATVSSSLTAHESLYRSNKSSSDNNPVSSLSSSGYPSIEPVTKFVNFNTISSQRPEGNPEETGLNLVKPKKRPDNTVHDHNWAPAHDNPSKLVHHRGDGATSSVSEGPRPMMTINDHEVVHGSKFGHLIRALKTSDDSTCARTDLQHTITSLTSADLEKKRAYLATVKISDASGIVSQDSCRRTDDSSRKMGSMAPPPPSMDRVQAHHGSMVPHQKNYSQPSSALHGQSSSSSTSSSHLSHRKIQSPASTTTSMPSGGGSRPHGPPYGSLVSNMARPSHMMNQGPPSLHPSLCSSPASIGNNSRPNVHMNPAMQSMTNNGSSSNSLLADYNNMNKVNMNDFLFYQNPAQNYEEMVKYQEMQKLFMMQQSIQMPSVRPMQWDPRFGPGADGWPGAMPVMGGMPMMAGGGTPDMQSLMRAMGLAGAAQSPQLGPRPRSGAGLNLSNGDAGSKAAVPGTDQSGSDLAGADLMEALRLVMADQMYQSMMAGGPQKGPMHLGGGGGPPLAHGVPFGAAGPMQGMHGLPGGVGGPPGPQKQQQSPQQPLQYAGGPSHSNGNGNQMRAPQNVSDLLQMLNYCNRAVPR